MRPVSAPIRAILASRRWRVYGRVWIEDPDGVMRDVTAFHGANWLDRAEWNEDADQPVASGTITLLREDLDLGVSLAPAIGASPANRNAADAYAPFLEEGRDVRIEVAVKAAGVAPIPGDYVEVMRGQIDAVRQSHSQNEVRLDFRDPGAVLLDADVLEVKTYADNDDGMLLEDVIQAVLDDNLGVGAVVLYVPVSPATVVRNQTIAVGKVLERIRDLALTNSGWDLRYKYDAAGVMRLTLDEPRRSFDPDVDDPDTLFAANEYTAIARLDIGIADIRNLIRVGFRNVDTGQREHVDVSDAVSIAKYRTRYMELNFADDGNINTVDEATAVANAALSDLSTPFSDHDVETIPFFWPAQIGDIYEFEQNGIVYDSNQIFAVTGFSHVLTADGGQTRFVTKGKVVGAIKEWKRRARVVLGPSDETDIGDVPLRAIGFHEKGRTPTDVTFAWQNDVRTFESWLWLLTYDQPVPTVPDPRPTLETPNPIRLGNDITEIEVPIPKTGQITYGLLVPFDADWNPGDGEEITQHPLDAIAIFANFKHTDGDDTLHRDVTFDVLDPGGRGGTLYAWTNHSSPDSANPDVLSEGSVVIPATPATISPATVFNLSAGGTSQLMNELRVHPGKGKRITVEYVNVDGISSGKQSFVILASGGAVDPNDELIAGIIKNTTPFASGVKPVTLYGTLPVSGLYVGQVAFQTSDNKLYKWNGSAWTAVVNAPDLVGQVTTTQIADAAINAQKIADAAVETAKMAVGAVTSDILAALAVTTTKIDDNAISTPKIIAGAITTGKIAAGAVTASEIAALTIVAANIAAGTITGAKIAAVTITAANIAALTITANEIAANTITGNKIAANTISAGNIVAGTITSTELAANSVIAGKIAAGAISATEIASDAITSAKIAANAVTAAKISVSTLSAIKDDAGIIVAGKLQNAAGTHYLDLNATGTNGFLVHSKMTLRANGNAEFSGDIIMAYSGNAILFKDGGTLAAQMYTFVNASGYAVYWDVYESGGAGSRRAIWAYDTGIAGGRFTIGGRLDVDEIYLAGKKLNLGGAGSSFSGLGREVYATN